MAELQDCLLSKFDFWVNIVEKDAETVVSSVVFKEANSDNISKFFEWWRDEYNHKRSLMERRW